MKKIFKFKDGVVSVNMNVFNSPRPGYLAPTYSVRVGPDTFGPFDRVRAARAVRIAEAGASLVGKTSEDIQFQWNLLFNPAYSGNPQYGQILPQSVPSCHA